ncbi:riboflavin synthase [Luteolibacter sp. GHJ8]|uniref:Riboflavin synthase n=1 Tax=Luteolibacter rhizosphaerae TaxID=2989719 RepID=A0ABT3FXQ7_9BACT|nr:riboflavin synthase [Luteolibacter rhizosphaerae]MCW1912366.1 riboflavin synthase [Luteolibacter rhizosphaerae]
MFTGLVETTGRVRSFERLGKQARLSLAIPFATELTMGESVAVNGCCLTVAAMDPEGACFDLLTQTLAVTSLGDLEEGSTVNLERALRAGDRFGGHFVQGHVDATGAVIALEAKGQDHIFDVSLPPEIERLCIDKGSLCVDGISLTIAELSSGRARFWITPHTFTATHLPALKTGARVNLEADLLAKHVAKLMDGFSAARGA